MPATASATAVTTATLAAAAAVKTATVASKYCKYTNFGCFYFQNTLRFVCLTALALVFLAFQFFGFLLRQFHGHAKIISRNH